MKNETLEMANKYLMPNYGKFGLEIVSGEGAEVFVRNEKGRKELCTDFLCGLGVSNLGQCHPEVVKAIIRQCGILGHVSNLYATKPMAKLAEILTGLSGLPDAKVFFCNSGTEANEAAGKLARIWGYENYGAKKNKIIALKNSFHGRTFLSISLTGQPKMQEMFSPVVPGISHVELNDVKGLRSAVDDDVCAIIFEIIQAEGGINFMSPEFYWEIKRLSEKHHFLRIVDEVQTGIGRTGEMFSFRYHDQGEGPDIITLAKALGGGLPIGATIAKGQVAKSLLSGSHAATFGGNPIVCAAALAVLKVIDQKRLCERVAYMGEYFQKTLSALLISHPHIVKEVRGRGFMIGVELHKPFSASEVMKRMRDKGVLVGTAGPVVVRFLPPLIATDEQINKVAQNFKDVIRGLSA